MLKLYFAPGVCSTASHIGLDESGAKYDSQSISFAKNEQKTPEHLKINPRGRVPALAIDEGVIVENTAILDYIAASSRRTSCRRIPRSAPMVAVGFDPAHESVILGQHREDDRDAEEERHREQRQRPQPAHGVGQDLQVAHRGKGGPDGKQQAYRLEGEGERQRYVGLIDGAGGNAEADDGRRQRTAPPPRWL